MLSLPRCDGIHFGCHRIVRQAADTRGAALTRSVTKEQ